MQSIIKPRRVVITGMGAVSPFGRGVEALFTGLKEGKSGIIGVDAMGNVQGMGPRVAGLVQGIDITEVPRKDRRSMSRMSIFAYMAAQEALIQANIQVGMQQNGRMGLIMCSTIGSAENLEFFSASTLLTIPLNK